MWKNNKGQGVRASGAWDEGARVQFKPHDPEAHVVTNIGIFAFCRRDRFCRCRKCKPGLK